MFVHSGNRNQYLNETTLPTHPNGCSRSRTAQLSAQIGENRDSHALLELPTHCKMEHSLAISEQSPIKCLLTSAASVELCGTVFWQRDIFAHSMRWINSYEALRICTAVSLTRQSYPLEAWLPDSRCIWLLGCSFRGTSGAEAGPKP